MTEPTRSHFNSHYFYFNCLLLLLNHTVGCKKTGTVRIKLTQSNECLPNKHLLLEILPGDQKGLFKLAVQLRKFSNSVIYNTATGYVLLAYLTNI
jgi:hypothetical protein